MPWGVSEVSQLRLSFVHLVIVSKRPVAEACRTYGISRKTGYKWLRRYQAAPRQPLSDRSRRPNRSPARTGQRTEQQILEVRDRYGWGGRKIHAFLSNGGRTMPSARTVTEVLSRHARIPKPQEPPPPPSHRFERAAPNELWQIDHKGPLEVERLRVVPLSVLDDHSRFCLVLSSCPDATMARVWERLWPAFQNYGLPQSILSDNAFGNPGKQSLGLSWFEARLIRLGIEPIHGRPYHPQTQGKVESFHGTLQRELWPRIRRDQLAHFDQDLEHWRELYNALRPHESLQNRPPLERWRPSPRRCPATLPDVQYPAGSLLRTVSAGGDISWQSYRILVGAGIVGQDVRVEDHNDEVLIFYAWKRVRSIAHSLLHRYTLL